MLNENKNNEMQSTISRCGYLADSQDGDLLGFHQPGGGDGGREAGGGGGAGGGEGGGSR